MNYYILGIRALDITTYSKGGYRVKHLLIQEYPSIKAAIKECDSCVSIQAFSLEIAKDSYIQLHEQKFEKKSKKLGFH